MANSRTAAIVLAAANATAVCLAQTPGAAGALALNGAAVTGVVAVLDAARRVLVTTVANETGKTLTIVGLDRECNPIREVLALPNAGSVYTIQDFLQVQSVTISAAAAGAISVGTNGVASTRWIRIDTNVPYMAASAAINLGGVTANVTLEVTLDPVDKQAQDRAAGTMDESIAGLPFSAFKPPASFAVAGATAVSGDTLAQIAVPIHAVRLTVNSGAATAGVRLTVLQQGVRA